MTAQERDHLRHLIDQERRCDANRWEWIARRLLVLGDYGTDISFFIVKVDEQRFLTDEWLAEWFGCPLADYMLDALHKADAEVVARP